MLTWLLGSKSTPPVLLHVRSSKTFIILTVSTAVFTDVFLYAIVVPVLPFALTSRAHVPASTTQTWISIFLAVYGASQLLASPLAGWFADRTQSRRWPMLLGLVALSGSTCMLCFGRSIGVLAIGRVLRGCSAAIVWSVGLALLVDTVGPEGIGEAMGWVGLALSLATLTSPLLGGIVFARAAYYAVFATAFGLIVMDVFLRVTMVEKKIAANWIVSPSVAKEPGPEIALGERGDSPLDIEKAPVTAASKDDFKVTATELSGNEEEINDGVENLRPEDQLPTTTHNLASRLPPIITLLASRRLLSALWCTTVVAILYTAMDAVLPLFVKHTFHWTSTGAGLIFLSIFVPTTLGPIVGNLSDKYGPRWFATVGAITTCPSLILLRLVHEDTLHQKLLLCALLAIIGFCLVLLITPTMAEITYAVEAKARRRPVGFFGKNGAFAQAYSLFNMAFACGTMIGPLVGGLTNGSHGWGTSTLILGCISIVTAVPAVLWTGGSIVKKLGGRITHGNGAV